MAFRMLAFPLVLALVAVAPLGAQDNKKEERDKEAKWQAAGGQFAKLRNAKEGSDRAKAAKAIGDATFAKHDKQAVAILLDHLKKELALGPDLKNEEKISGEVLLACEGALKKATAQDAVDALIKEATIGGAKNARSRFFVIRALGTQKSAAKTLIDLVDDKEPLIQLAAVNALTELKDPAGIDALVKVLNAKDRTWEQKLSAVAGIDGINDSGDKAVDGLIDSLEKLGVGEGRIETEVIRVLGRFLGIADPKTNDPVWWRQAKKDKNAPVGEGTRTEPTKFFDMEARSSRVIFVLDTTGSMDEFIVWPANTEASKPVAPQKEKPKGKPDPAEDSARAKATEIANKYAALVPATRMNGLKKELVYTVYHLDGKALFAIVWFDGVAFFWKETMVQATWANKLECLKHIEGMPANGMTNMWGGVEAGFGFVGAPGKPEVVSLDKKANHATGLGGADTIFLMTDGMYNMGKFVGDVKAFRAEIQKANITRRIVFNTVLIGDIGSGLPQETLDLMKDIAADNGGNFKHIGGK